MKRTAYGHSKIKALAEALHKPQYAAVGILELLWHCTARETPAGNIGKLSNKSIAAAVDWRGKPDDLINALVATGWIDEDDFYRLVIHDWSDHADDAVHMMLARTGKLFAGGKVPSLAKINVKDRPEIEERLEAERRKWEEAIGAHRQAVRTNAHKRALPSHAMPSQAEPRQAEPPFPAASAAGGVGETTFDEQQDGPPMSPEWVAQTRAEQAFQAKYIWPEVNKVLTDRIAKFGENDPLAGIHLNEMAVIALRVISEHREEHERLQEARFRLQDSEMEVENANAR